MTQEAGFEPVVIAPERRIQPDQLRRLLLMIRPARPTHAGATLGIGRRDHAEGPRHSLVEQGLEADGVAGPRLEGLAVVAEDGAEGHVHEFDRADAPAAGRLEYLLEVLALPVVDHVENAIGLPVLPAPLDRGQVGGCVEKRAHVPSAAEIADDPKTRSYTVTSSSVLFGGERLEHDGIPHPPCGIGPDGNERAHSAARDPGRTTPIDAIPRALP